MCTYRKCYNKKVKHKMYISPEQYICLWRNFWLFIKWNIMYIYLKNNFSALTTFQFVSLKEITLLFIKVRKLKCFTSLTIVLLFKAELFAAAVVAWQEVTVRWSGDCVVTMAAGTQQIDRGNKKRCWSNLSSPVRCLFLWQSKSWQLATGLGEVLCHSTLHHTNFKTHHKSEKF